MIAGINKTPLILGGTWQLRFDSGVPIVLAIVQVSPLNYLLWHTYQVLHGTQGKANLPVTIKTKKMDERYFLAVGSSSTGTTFTVFMMSDILPPKGAVLKALRDRYHVHIPNFVSISEITKRDFEANQDKY